MIINSRNDKSMPMNSEIMFDVSRIIKPKKLVVPYYTLGTENVAWVEGYSHRNGDQSKQGDHLLLEIFVQDLTAERTYVTDLEVNLTNVKTLYVDWEHVSPDDAEEAVLVVSTVKMEDRNTFDVRNIRYFPFSRRVDSIDVSGVTGNYYIRVHGRASGPREGQLKVYRVWGEG